MTITHTKPPVALNARSLWFTPVKEEAYFTATFTPPRVGEVSASYSADRYVVTAWHGKNKPREEWSAWRIYRRDDIAGVGPKTADTLRELVNPVILEWLESPAYLEARQKAIAQFIIRELRTSHYSIAHARETFEAFRSELSHYDHTRIAQALDHLEAAATLLDDEVPV